MSLFRMVMPARRVAGAGLAALLGLSAGFEVPVSLAAEMTISARYRGDASGQFENTTPPAAFCSEYAADCSGKATAQVPFTYTKTSIKEAPDLSSRFIVRVPNDLNVLVTNEQGDSFSARIRINAFSQRVQGTIDTNPIYSDGPTSGSGCTGMGSREYGSSMSYLWANHTFEIRPCYSDNRDALVGQAHVSDVDNMGIIYTLFTPSPTTMRGGIYRGSATFSVGGGDFDFGRNVTNLNSPTLTVNVELDVQHSFDLEFAPGSERVILEPPGGWEAWGNGGQAPPRLYHDVPLRIWASGPFSVYLRCEDYVLGGCAIRRPGNHPAAALFTSLTLPDDIRMKNGGGSVRRMRLGQQQQALEPSRAVSGLPGELHFQVEGSFLSEMLRWPGSSWTAGVTVVFDASL
ncbi:hypothetical protein M2D63_002520 [Pseudomonas sp. BJa5]|uniref:hypothetical protein n=1 Tax=Pseudomonas sp. BJa5 TaxID=2936270 RepID=UPI0025596EB1|nr:hypothetical protein [Pseudomonas sp. BGr12]MDL2419994.1 hypothetical protein [Pseudomonas sp. BGr12]